MNINSRNINIIYLFLYFSLLVGFYFNEDFAFGYKADYSLHYHLIISSLKEDFFKTCDKHRSPHLWKKVKKKWHLKHKVI